MAIDKVMRLEGASITWTNKQVAKMIEKETISFDNIVQRGEVWEVNTYELSYTANLL